jgi:orotidine-5'-phosphate decarboxylase
VISDAVASAADAGAGAASRPSGGFGDRLASLVAERSSQIVLGLDPDPARLWPRALRDRVIRGSAAERAAHAVAAHCLMVMEAAGEQCVAVKPQVACFERLGAPGWAALAHVVAAAQERGLLVIADGKRGDIDISARAYGQAFFGGVETGLGPVPGLGADALTVNPLLGRDALTPLVQAARDCNGGVFVLVRTSNPGAADVQELRLSDGRSVSDALGELVGSLGAAGVGPAGLADVGAVIGATAPERLQALRAVMPRAPFLLPGVGAQGGRVEDLAAAFAPGRAGGVVAVSRAIVYAAERIGGEPEAAAAREAARLRELTWDLSG